MQILDALKKAIAKSGLSNSEIARRTLISQAQISRVANGISEPTISAAEKIATALGKKITLK